MKNVGPIPRSATRTILETLLSALRVDEVVSWESIEAATGRPRVELYSIAMSARRALRRKLKAHFQTVLGEGVQRVEHQYVGEHHVPDATRKIRRRAQEARRLIGDVNLSDLSNETRLSVIAHGTVAALVSRATDERNVKKLARKQTDLNLDPKEVGLPQLT